MGVTGYERARDLQDGGCKCDEVIHEMTHVAQRACVLSTLQYEPCYHVYPFDVVREDVAHKRTGAHRTV